MRKLLIGLMLALGLTGATKATLLVGGSSTRILPSACISDTCNAMSPTWCQAGTTMYFCDLSGGTYIALASGSVTSFLALTDTPDAYAGHSLKVVRVNAGETALEFAVASGGSALTCEEADGSPTVASVDTIQFDSADGFTVTDETGGNIQVDFVPPSTFVLDSESPAAGDITGTFAAGLAVGANAVVLATDTTGDFVSGITASQGLLKTGTEDATLGLIDCAENQILKSTGAGGTSWTCQSDSTGGSPTFDAIGSGTNATASMIVGTGASLTTSGSGTITANRVTCTDGRVYVSTATDTPACDAGFLYDDAGDDATLVGTMTAADFATSGSTAGSIVLTEDSPGANKVTIASQAARTNDLVANFPDVAGTLEVSMLGQTIAESELATEDYGDFNCAGAADDCLIDDNAVDADELAGVGSVGDAWIFGALTTMAGAAVSSGVLSVADGNTISFEGQAGNTTLKRDTDLAAIIATVDGTVAARFFDDQFDLPECPTDHSTIALGRLCKDTPEGLISFRDSHGSRSIPFLEDGGSGVGDVVGPELTVDNEVALFDGITGNLLKNSGFTFNISAVTCTGDSAGGALTVNGSNQIVCSADDGGAGSGDNVQVEDGDNAGTYTAATNVDFEDSGDINFVLNATPSPDEISAQIRANAVGSTEIADTAVTEAKLASEDYGDFTCGAGADDCVLDTGAVADGELASNYSGVGVCAAGSAATTLLDNAAPTCSATVVFTDEASTWASAGTQVFNDPVSLLPDATNGVTLNSSGLLAKAGTGSIQADDVVCTGCVVSSDVASLDVSDDLNLTALRSLTVNGDGIDADAELYTDTKCMVIESPVDADNFLFWRVDYTNGVTVTGIDCLVTAATSIPVTVQECNSNGGACGTTEAAITCATTNSTEAAGIDDAAWDATDWIRLDMGAPSGTPTQLSVCVTFTVTD